MRKWELDELLPHSRSGWIRTWQRARETFSFRAIESLPESLSSTCINSHMISSVQRSFTCFAFLAASAGTFNVGVCASRHTPSTISTHTCSPLLLSSLEF